MQFASIRTWRHAEERPLKQDARCRQASRRQYPADQH